MKVSISDEKIQKIKEMREQGLSYELIAHKLNIGTSTAKKYAPGGTVVRQERKDHKVAREQFTQRQLEIASRALENIKKNGIIQNSYWHKETK